MSTKNSGVAIGQDGEIVTLNIHEREDNIFPAVHKEDPEVFLEAVSKDRICRVDEQEENVIEESLEGRNVRANICKESGEGIGRGNTKGEDLSKIEIRINITRTIKRW